MATVTLKKEDLILLNGFLKQVTGKVNFKDLAKEIQETCGGTANEAAIRTRWWRLAKKLGDDGKKHDGLKDTLEKKTKKTAGGDGTPKGKAKGGVGGRGKKKVVADEMAVDGDDADEMMIDVKKEVKAEVQEQYDEFYDAED